MKTFISPHYRHQSGSWEKQRLAEKSNVTTQRAPDCQRLVALQEAPERRPLMCLRTSSVQRLGKPGSSLQSPAPALHNHSLFFIVASLFSQYSSRCRTGAVRNVHTSLEVREECSRDGVYHYLLAYRALSVCCTFPHLCWMCHSCILHVVVVKHCWFRIQKNIYNILDTVLWLWVTNNAVRPIKIYFAPPFSAWKLSGADSKFQTQICLEVLDLNNFQIRFFYHSDQALSQFFLSFTGGIYFIINKLYYNYIIILISHLVCQLLRTIFDFERKKRRSTLM